MSVRRISITVIFAAVALTGAPGIADAARPIESSHYDDTFSDVRHLCGRDWDVLIHDAGHFQVRATPTGTPVDLVHDVHAFERRYTAQDNGDQYVIAGRENFRISGVREIEPGVYSATFATAGRTWQMRSVSGTVIWTDRGRFTYSGTIDTQGDADPSNDVYDLDLSWTGPHFFSDTLPGSQYCGYVDAAIAAG